MFDATSKKISEREALEKEAWWRLYLGVRSAVRRHLFENHRLTDAELDSIMLSNLPTVTRIVRSMFRKDIATRHVARFTKKRDH